MPLQNFQPTIFIARNADQTCGNLAFYLKFRGLVVGDRIGGQPSGEIAFSEVARRHRKHCQNAVGIRRYKPPAVEAKKQLYGDKGYAFIAIDECVVVRNAATVSGGQRAGVRLATCRQMQWLGKC